jgi:hypothetical protein
MSRAERKRIQQPRHRREHIGKLVQIDGSEHRWFEGRADACTLLVFVDDATSRLMELRFIASESTFAPVDPRQDLDQILCWREPRQVSHQLVVN